MLQALKKLFSRHTDVKKTTDTPPAPPGLDAALNQAGTSFRDWLSVSKGRVLYCDLDSSALEDLKTRFPALADRTVSAAKTVLSHQFDLLGSGPFVPKDPQRPAGDNGYRPINWYLDPVQKLCFPTGIHYKDWDLFKMRPGNADIKLPWELSRCQHFTALGQAYRLTGDDTYAHEIVHEIEDFMQANPVGMGVNWTCTMDAAIRAANWCLGLELIRGCTSLSEDTLKPIYSAVFDHGEFIFANFENTYEVTSNHYLSNLVGLLYVAAVFSGFPKAGEWNTYCKDALEEEIQKQVLPDGADYESSIPYHRLVLELFLGAARLSSFQGSPLSQPYHEKLRDMTKHLISVLRPDGRMPVVGDADDGRLHIFTDYSSWDPQSGLHVIAPAALLLDHAEWLKYTGEEGLWEATWWGFDTSGLQPQKNGLPEAVELFPEAGCAVYRSSRTYLLVTNALVGTDGFGNHKHNDQLSFEYHFGGIPIIVDPGSYVYTSNPEARNRFRSTASHNTVMVDGQEQNEINPEWLFRMFETARAEHLSFSSDDQTVRYTGRHSGYRRLEDAVTHTRTLQLLKDSGALIIVDTFSGSGTHLFQWHFHFAPGITARQAADRVLEVSGNGAGFIMQFPANMDIEVLPAAYSPSYGVCVECTAVNLRCEVSLVEDAVFTFALGPERWYKALADEQGLETLLHSVAAETCSRLAAP